MQATLVECLREQVQRRPDRVAFRFLETGEVQGPTQALSYAELEACARGLGARLQEAGSRGERVLLMLPPGLDFIVSFLGCLYAGAVAVPVYLPDPARLARTLPRLQAIVEDSRPRVVLTTAAILDMVESLRPSLPALGALRFEVVEHRVEATRAEAWRPPGLQDKELAFLQYTSGSTGTPRGVMISHANLLHNAHAIAQLFDPSLDSAVFWLPPYHDMGLIGGIVQPIYVGGTSNLMSPLSFLERPLRWVEALSHFRSPISGAPDFAYRLCARRAAGQDLSHLDLSSWVLAFNGSERVRAETLDQFCAAFAPAGFRRESLFPCYGLAEATLLVTGAVRGQPPPVCTVKGSELEAGRVRTAAEGEQGARRLVACGRLPEGSRLVLADPKTLRRCSDDQVGEVWVTSLSVAQGYWGRSEETRNTFQAHLADTGEGPFLRTGDMGFLYGGQLYPVGRLKDLIIIRGRNLSPEDVEQVAESAHPALRPGSGAAFSVEGEEGERLVVVQEVAEGSEERTLEEATAAIRQAVVEQLHVLVEVVVLVAARSIPKTSSGKIQRHACRQGWLEGTLMRVGGTAPEPKPVRAAAAPSAEAAELEQWLVEWLARRAGVSASAVEVGQPLWAHGLDSLGAAELSEALTRKVGMALPMQRLWEPLSLRELAAELVRLAPAARAESAAARAESPSVKAVRATARPEPLRQGEWRRGAPLSECYPTLVRLSTALPERVLEQRELYERVFREWYRELPNAEQIFRGAGVERRHSYMDPEVVLRRQGKLSTAERMKLWRQGTLELAGRSVRGALEGVEPGAVGSFVMVSCTGYDTPSPDMMLAHELGLKASLRRTFIGHMGCYAAFNGLKVALDALAARPDEAVLVNCTELCSLHVRTEPTVEQAVCHALFGDASATVLLAQAPAGTGPQVLRTHSETLYAEAEHMGWTITDEGFRMFLSPHVPLILAREVRGFVERMLAPLRLERRDVRHWGIHPGGPKIVDLVAKELGLTQRDVGSSLEVLRQYGNCSSPTVLLVLEHLLREERPRPGEVGVLLAFGPGLTLEGMVVRF